MAVIFDFGQESKLHHFSLRI